MKPLVVLKNLTDFLDKNKYLLILLWFLAFMAYRFAKRIGVFGFLGWVEGPSSFMPGLDDIVLFIVVSMVFLLSYKFCFRFNEKRRVAMIFISACILFAGFTQFSQPMWLDAEG